MSLKVNYDSLKCECEYKHGAILLLFYSKKTPAVIIGLLVYQPTMFFSGIVIFFTYFVEVMGLDY